MLDITQLKSAVVIDDPAEIQRTLKAAAEKAGRAAAVRSGGPDQGHAVMEKLVGKASLKAEVPPADELQRLAEAAGIEWHQDFASRAIPYWASDERVDGMGDIVKQTWHFDEFATNPVMPYSHQWSQPPVANALVYEVRTRKEEDYSGPALYVLGLFARAEQWEWADTVFRLVKGGFLLGGSVGFYSTKVIDVKDEDERAELGLGRWGYILDENHLLEFSPTTLPANPGALAILSRAKQDGMLLPKDFSMIREVDRARIARSSRSGEEWREVDSKWLQMAKTLFPDQRKEFAPHKELDAPLIEKQEPTTLPVREDTRSLEEKLDRVLSLIEDQAISQGKRLDDIQSEVEELKELLALRTGTEPEQGDTSGLVLEGVDADRVSSLLAKLNGLGTGSGA